MALNRGLRNAEHLGDLFVGEAGEETELYQFGLLRVVFGKLIQRLVQTQEFLVVHVRGEVETVEVHAFHTATMAHIIFASGIVNQYAPHGLGGCGEKVGAILPGGLVVTAEPQPGFVNQGRGLQGLSGRFPSHLLRRELAQLFVDQRQEFIRRLGIALINALKDDGEFAHTEIIS